MKPAQFKQFITKGGKLEEHAAGQVFHAQAFHEKVFLLKTGYVKRCQASKPGDTVIELIYGPGQIISLSQLYKRLFGVDQNQENTIYVYQTMTDVEVWSIDASAVEQELDHDPELYKDFFYQSGLILRSNILRLASNALKDDYEKVAHQIVSLVYEFGGSAADQASAAVVLPLPQAAIDIAEQLNISEEAAEAALERLRQHGLIRTQGSTITVLDVELLKDVYL